MISFARGAPAPECLDADLLADCARAAIETRPVGARLRPRRRLRAAARVARRPARGRAGPGPPDDRRPPGLRLLRGGAPRRAARPRAGRGADLRPPAEDPRPARSRGRARCRWTAKGSTRMRSSASSPRARRASSTRSRPSRTRAAARSRPSGAAASSSSPRAHGVPVLEDDPYGLVRYEGEAPPSLYELEGGELVTYASSFSKTVAPGVRVGWFVAPAELAARHRGAGGVHLHLAAVPDAGDRARADRPAARSSRTSSGSAAC